MKARLLERTPGAPGSVLILLNGIALHATDRLQTGRSSQSPPAIGDEFDPSFSYQLEEGTEPRLLTPVDGPAERLRHLGDCNYDAVGRILSIESLSPDRRVLVAKVACAGCVLPSPLDVNDPSLIGRFVAFRITQLEVWRA